MAREASDLKLAFGMEFYELYDRNGLARLDAAFIDCLRECAPGLAERVATVRAAPDGIDRKAESELMAYIIHKKFPHLFYKPTDKGNLFWAHYPLFLYLKQFP